MIHYYKKKSSDLSIQRSKKEISLELAPSPISPLSFSFLKATLPPRMATSLQPRLIYTHPDDPDDPDDKEDLLSLLSLPPSPNRETPLSPHDVDYLFRALEECAEELPDFYVYQPDDRVQLTTHPKKKTFRVRRQADAFHYIVSPTKQSTTEFLVSVTDMIPIQLSV